MSRACSLARRAVVLACSLAFRAVSQAASRAPPKVPAASCAMAAAACAVSFARSVILSALAAARSPSLLAWSVKLVAISVSPVTIGSLIETMARRGCPAAGVVLLRHAPEAAALSGGANGREELIDLRAQCFRLLAQLIGGVEDLRGGRSGFGCGSGDIADALRHLLRAARR